MSDFKFAFSFPGAPNDVGRNNMEEAVQTQTQTQVRSPNAPPSVTSADAVEERGTVLLGKTP